MALAHEDRPVDRANLESESGGTATIATRSDVLPWYKRGKALLISAGALAGASLAVLGLWDRIFPTDPGDVARIESVDMVGQTSFKEFAHERFGVEFPLEPASNGEAARQATVVLQVSTPEPVLPLDEPISPPESEMPVAPPDSTSPSDIPATTPPEPDPSTIPAPDPPVTAPPSSPDPDDSPLTPLESFTFLPPEAYLEVLSTAPDLDELNLDRKEVEFSYLLVIRPTGEDGEELPAEEAAVRVAEALSSVESKTDAAGDRDPSGWSVSVNLTLEGLAGVPLLLTWSIDGVDVPEEWAAEKISYRVVASTPRDAGSAEIWVPQLKVPGQYNVNVRLNLASDPDTTIASGPPLTILIPE
jgi:hypothetical protein